MIQDLGPTTSPEEFYRLFQDGKLCFLAGSGISLDSGLPSAKTILERTLEVVLPNMSPFDRDQVLEIQPEVFYESLLAYAQPESRLDALSMWLSLHPRILSQFGSTPDPNIVHYTLVEYASRHRVPIFTTNFDLMFEEAADRLNIKPKVVMKPQDWSADLSGTDVIICKLHGSIDKDGSPDLKSLLTTMTQISTMNTWWIESIRKLMERYHLCFVGYSGRDIDIFPFVEQHARRGLSPGHPAIDPSRTSPLARRPIWINYQFENDDPVSVPASHSCASRMAGEYPSELFKRLFKRAPTAAAQTTDANSPCVPATDTALNYLSDQLRSKLSLRRPRRRSSGSTCFTSVACTSTHTNRYRRC